MSRTFDVVFGEGVDESSDRLALPDGRLAFMQNMRPDRFGRLEVRPSHTALATTVYGAGTLTAYDLTNYRGRLTALGTRSTADVLDLFEFVDGAAAWRGSRAGTPALSIATDVRAVGRTPLLSDGVQIVDVASDGSQYLCSVASLADGSGVVHVFDPSNDQTILLTAVAELERARVVYAGSDFWVVGFDGDDDLVMYNFDPSADESLSSVTTVQSSAATRLDVAVGQMGTGFVIAASRISTDTEIFTRNSAGAAVTNWTATDPPGTIGAHAVMGNDDGDRVIYAYHDTAGSDDYSYIVYTSTGVVQTAETSLWGGSTTSVGKIAIGYDSANDVAHLCGVIDSGSLTALQHTQLSGADFDTVTNFTQFLDGYLTARPVTAPLGTFFGAQDGISADNNQGTNMLVTALQGALSTKLPAVALDNMIADPPTTASINDVNGSAVIGSKIYWATRSQSGVTSGSYRDDGQQLATYAINEATIGSTGRRQMSEIGGALYVSGGLPARYDGRVVAEQGFFERPQIISLTGSAEGSPAAKTNSGVYRVRLVWMLLDAQGNVLRSSASGTADDILTDGGRTITLGASDDTITLVGTTPHSWLTGAVLEESGMSVRVEAYCTAAGGETYFFDTAAIVPGSSYGSSITLTLNVSDADLETRPILYLQSQTPLPHHAPVPYRYTWPGRQRQVVGGTPRTEAWYQSKLLFPGEPVEFAAAGRLGFFGRLGRDITGVAAFDNAAVMFTEDSIWLIAGRGPEHDGSGDFDPPIRVASVGGLLDWRSLVATPMGLFFQMAPDKLMLLARPGADLGQVAWVGEPVQDTLASYPNVVGAVHLRNEMRVAFGCTNDAGDDSRVLLYDLSNGQWSVETAPGALDAIGEYQGRLTMISGGTVYLEDAAIASGSGALPTGRVETGSFKVFGGNGEGDLMAVVLSYERIGDCNVEGFVSYDDGATWTTMGDFDIAVGSAPHNSGTNTLVYHPARRTCSRFAVRFDITNASDTGGVRLRMLSFEVDAEEYITRQPAGNTR